MLPVKQQEKGVSKDDKSWEQNSSIIYQVEIWRSYRGSMFSTRAISEVQSADDDLQVTSSIGEEMQHWKHQALEMLA